MIILAIISCVVSLSSFDCSGNQKIILAEGLAQTEVLRMS